MFSSFLPFVAILASVHSFTFVAAVEQPQITPAPAAHVAKRQVAGGPGTPILSTISYPHTALPEQVYPYPVLRGPQYGYNICNSTTQGNSSRCQTLIVNSEKDFCLWGSPDPNGLIGDMEAKVVAYCTQNTHGSRPIPFGAITGLQFTRTPAYIQIHGFIDNTALSLSPEDAGGELDPHGADLQGNPLGGVVYTNATSFSTDGSLSQVMNWNQFVGHGHFCIKLCDNSITSPDYCENRYDLIGCSYNMPSNVENGTYTSCDGDVQDVVGVYTVDGVVSTWSMPATLSAPPPYTPRVPSSSNCQTFQATDLFVAPPTTSATATATATGTRGSGSGSSGSETGSGSSASSTSSSSSAVGLMMGGGVPSAFYALGLGIMAGIALVV